MSARGASLTLAFSSTSRFPDLLEYSFSIADPTNCRYSLERLQTKAHWLVLASRQPLYRAVQQCGTSTLLDFYSVTERGRPVHVCVGLDIRNASHDVARLRRMLQALTMADIDEAETEAVLFSARRLAPGLALSCIGSTGGVDLSGLLGLLLSARAMEMDDSPGLLLALDQHRDLLTGRGKLSDLLRIRLAGDRVIIDVIEAQRNRFMRGVLMRERTKQRPLSMVASRYVYTAGPRL